ncbi:hypothetical protein [Paraburkholderia adhaesiva]|uniref:hypothetical protein n=1 Tax=Paraburkholderia adhaesiva TaxID=2883244 RepID=UPI001F32CDA6|nr:hypothetical protein [Paraburkholderia adhaesiva]
MTSQNIVMFLVGISFVVIGYLLSTNEKVAAWGLNHGHARIWISLLGKERAMKLTKYFFGPLSVLLGVVAISAVLVVFFSK